METPFESRPAAAPFGMIEKTLMRRPCLIASAVTVLIALGLTACGDSSQSGFTAQGRPPLDPSDWTSGKPSPQMADEAEGLIASERGDSWASPDCVPEESLDGTGEFNFKCTAVDLGSGERRQLDVVVFGSESGRPELGPIIAYVCDPGPTGDGGLQGAC